MITEDVSEWKIQFSDLRIHLEVNLRPGKKEDKLMKIELNVNY